MSLRPPIAVFGDWWPVLGRECSILRPPSLGAASGGGSISYLQWALRRMRLLAGAAFSNHSWFATWLYSMIETAAGPLWSGQCAQSMAHHTRASCAFSSHA